MTALRAAYLAVAAAVCLLGAHAAAASGPACLGAAALDASHPCSNPTLTVVPELKAAKREGGSPCGPTRQAPDLVCTFGTPARRANQAIALVGDSHALHWLAALDSVAQAKGWHGFSITTPGCFLSDATSALEVNIREHCVSWYRRVQAWFAVHPEVSTVFVSQRAATPVVPPAGQTQLAVKVEGFRRAWRQLPASVRRIIVIRDVPTTPTTTPACIRSVLAAGLRRPEQACRTSRAASVSADPAVLAVLVRPARRYTYVDLTDYFCSHRYCYPVVGGVLVYRDAGHMTTAYSKTLGPYLLRKVNGCLARS